MSVVVVAAAAAAAPTVLLLLLFRLVATEPSSKYLLTSLRTRSKADCVPSALDGRQADRRAGGRLPGWNPLRLQGPSNPPTRAVPVGWLGGWLVRSLPACLPVGPANSLLGLLGRRAGWLVLLLRLLACLPARPLVCLRGSLSAKKSEEATLSVARRHDVTTPNASEKEQRLHQHQRRRLQQGKELMPPSPPSSVHMTLDSSRECHLSRDRMCRLRGWLA